MESQIRTGLFCVGLKGKPATNSGVVATGWYEHCVVFESLRAAWESPAIRFEVKKPAVPPSLSFTRHCALRQS